MYQETQRHLKILGEREDFFLGRPEGERMFFPRRKHPNYPMAKEDFSEEVSKEKTFEAS